MRLYSLSIILILAFQASSAWAIKTRTYLGDEAFEKEAIATLDSFYDPKANYALFPGRVTDKDASGMVFKISSENANIKFFRAGDMLEFHVAQNEKTDPCQGYVRNVEEGFFSLYVKDLAPCWKKDDYLRRGTILSFKSKILADRVKNAAVYRASLLKRKDDFLNQLNGINHFIWSYDQKRTQLAAEYDKRIMEIEKEKQKELQSFLVKKTDSMRLQQELIFKLDSLEKDLDFYRVEKNELLIDRWHADGDLGVPVGNRPQELHAE